MIYDGVLSFWQPLLDLMSSEFHADDAQGMIINLTHTYAGHYTYLLYKGQQQAGEDLACRQQ